MTFSVEKKYNKAFRDRIDEKKLNLNVVLVAVLVLESKGLY